MLSYPAGLACTVALSAACATALFLLGGRRPGRARALPALAVAAVNACVPLLYDRSTAFVSIAMVSFLVTWLSSFKALAWAGGRGPLALQRWGWAQFLALYALPIVPLEAPASPSPTPSGGGDPVSTGTAGGGRGGVGGGSSSGEGRARGGESLASSPVLVLRWAAKLALTAAVVFVLQTDPPQVAKELLYCLGIYGMLGCVMDGPASLVFGFLGLRLQPHFRAPWMALSISRFWGMHWNQAASNSLRTAIYDPLLEGAWVKPEGGAAAEKQQAQQAQQRGVNGGSGGHGGSRAKSRAPARAALALCASCFVSGMVHEIIIAYVFGGKTTNGVWLAFFTFQGPLILGERIMLRALGRAGIKPPPLLRRAATLCTLLAAAHYLFFAPAERLGLPTSFAAAMRHAFAELAGVGAGAGASTG